MTEEIVILNVEKKGFAGSESTGGSTWVSFLEYQFIRNGDS